MAVSGAIFRTLIPFPLHRDVRPPSFNICLKPLARLILLLLVEWTWSEKENVTHCFKNCQYNRATTAAQKGQNKNVTNFCFCCWHILCQGIYPPGTLVTLWISLGDDWMSFCLSIRAKGFDTPAWTPSSCPGEPFRYGTRHLPWPPLTAASTTDQLSSPPLWTRLGWRGSRRCPAPAHVTMYLKLTPGASTPGRIRWMPGLHPESYDWDSFCKCALNLKSLIPFMFVWIFFSNLDLDHILFYWGGNNPLSTYWLCYSLFGF